MKVFSVSNGAELNLVRVGDSQDTVNYVRGLALRNNDLFVGVCGSVSLGYRIAQFHLATGEKVRWLTGPATTEIYALALSSDGSRLAFRNHYVGATVVDTVSGQSLTSIPTSTGGNVGFSPDGSRLFVSGNGTLHSIPDGTALWNIGDNWSEGFFHPMGDSLPFARRVTTPPITALPV
ncbi:MAG: hypothetical protein RMK92_03805 [Armatimonadota bacterium]|nr:hypothetical protein [Armatimonadota bacterium]